MKPAVVFFGLLVACALCYAAEESAAQPPLMVALQPQANEVPSELIMADPQVRQKRGLLLGALGAGALGAGAIGAGVVGAGILGAGAVGAGIIGAKAGVIGGALAAKALYPHYRYYGGYRNYHYAPTVYVIDDWW